jgi:hypothetical protein
MALRWIVAICGSVKGLGAEKKVSKVISDQLSVISYQYRDIYAVSHRGKMGLAALVTLSLVYQYL